MSRKAIRREDVEIRWFTDDVYTGTRIDKNRHIFKNKDGSETITSFGVVTRDAVTGKLFVERRCRKVQALNILDIVKRVKETGGSIVILPP